MNSALKHLQITLFAILLLLTSINFSVAQPFKYSFVATTDKMEGDIYRTNLQTGNSELFLKDAGCVMQIFDNIDASKLFVQGRRFLEVIDLQSNNERKTILENFDWIHNIFDAPLTNRIYISIGGEDIYDYEKTIVLDRTTYDSLASIGEFMSSEPPFLSKDESKYFRIVWDSSGIYFDGYQCTNGSKIFSRRRCGNSGPFAFQTGLASVRKSIGVVNVYTSQTEYFLSQQYIVCDVDQMTVLSVIPFPLRSEVSLSAEASYVIIEQVDFNKSRESAEYRPGNIYVFDTKTGILLQQLKLPPEGKILLFDNYPDKLFYLTGIEGSFQSTQVPLNVITQTTALMDSLITLTNQAYVQSWLGDANFVKELNNGLENARKHLLKEDSVNCSKEIAVFQEKIKKEYEKHSTLKDKRFVTEEGYKFLYFNAQYIVDRLPQSTKGKQ